MKFISLFGLLAGVFLVAGCADVADDVSNHLPGEGAPIIRTFPGTPRATFASAKAALDQISFHFTHGGPAQGEMRASSDITPGDQLGSSHQFTLKAEFHATLDGTGTDVSVRFSEVIEADSKDHPGMGTETPLKDTALAEVFFRAIQQGLSAPAKP